MTPTPLLKKILVWDLPLRLFHGAFAGSLTAALAIGFLVDDESPLFQLHALFGLVAVFTLVLRLGLGLFGSRHNRFKAFPVRPSEVFGYSWAVLSGKARRYPAHNPGGASVALAMFAVVPLLVATGIGVWGESGEELHEGLAVALLVLIGAHFVGLMWHTLRHREPIALSMLTGRKLGEATDELASSRPLWALVILAAFGAWVWALFASHDSAAGTVKLPLIGTVISVGENEAGEGAEGDENAEASQSKAGKKGHAADNEGDD
jgi:cytochrome b